MNAMSEEKGMMTKKKTLGNGVVGILAESVNKWERRAPLTPSHCARLLHGGKDKTGISRIVIQPSTKRIHHDALYEDVGCEISDDLSECGLILGIKQPKLEMILPDRAYAFFSHTHKAQKENMPLLDKILADRVTLYDYELIVGDHGRRLLAFGKYAGRAGLVDFLHGLGQRYLSLGYSTPFLSLGSSYMYSSLAAAKAAVISIGEEIATQGLPSGICPLVFVFTGTGNVSLGAQEIFKLLPHTMVEPNRLPELFEKAKGVSQNGLSTKRIHQVYGCIVTSQDMVEHLDPTEAFDKVDYYTHPEHYKPVFHEKIAPYTSVLVNCMYWEKRFPRLLSTEQLRDLTDRGCPLVGICDITCDIGGSIEFVNRATLIDSPFFRFDPMNNSYHNDMEGNGVLSMAVDILPTEFAKEASQHFGDILSQFIGSFASTTDIEELPPHLKRACITHGGMLTSLFEYIPRMRSSDPEDTADNTETGFSNKNTYNTLVSLSGHLFDKFLINEALDIIEAAGGSFHLTKCHVGQSTDAESYSELEVGADDRAVLDQIIDSLTRLANPNEDYVNPSKETNKISLKIGKVQEENGAKEKPEMMTTKKKSTVLILGAGRVCRPAAELLASVGNISAQQWYEACLGSDPGEQTDVRVLVASLYLKDAKETVEGIPNAEAIQLDISDSESLLKYISQVDVVISLLPASCHTVVAKTCIEMKKHLVTASYVDDATSMLHEKAKKAGITILGEMGLDPGIDHMMAMKMINDAQVRKGKIKSFTSYCGGLPSPAAANNPLAYKFSWNPAGAIRAGRNPATYKHNGETVHIDGENLYDSATRFRIADLPAFALECLPNRDSLVYGKIYGIENEASTIFRGTLRYEGFSETMGTLAKLGFFDNEANQSPAVGKRITFSDLLSKILEMGGENGTGPVTGEKAISERISNLGHNREAAAKAAKTIVFLGFNEEREIPASCKNMFDATCLLMEEKLAFSGDEQDMVLLHHQIEVEFPESRRTEIRRATMLEFGSTKNGATTTAMAKTVGIPAAIGALLLMEDKIETRGVLRPIEPEVYLPALEILQAYGIKLMEKTE
ncbi:PREDICTED: alpha-aminoadipic semialdehyde synthase [Tarenaya hassleriana]|uniref:alpha-aminoadipic semialdehyde synthase n=1 Tax=Tarenaya hassleriana TaxID=28532 RepID=UPI00053C7B4F|nr:PREDICTED: alpha-aminoadipic semialdehyde synthase [Tarenaya hassleriana]XP_010527056.1 PREDICTED: alpha-aminoadipic semialdehyde synthase [Tarenaya hassleriana]XP_010527057.1 PREDICTED: alpha-aminoadipic semialdehyde synthase [Tarenaya hassleriana]